MKLKLPVERHVVPVAGSCRLHVSARLLCRGNHVERVTARAATTHRLQHHLALVGHNVLIDYVDAVAENPLLGVDVLAAHRLNYLAGPRQTGHQRLHRIGWRHVEDVILQVHAVHGGNYVAYVFIGNGLHRGRPRKHHGAVWRGEPLAHGDVHVVERGVVDGLHRQPVLFFYRESRLAFKVVVLQGHGRRLVGQRHILGTAIHHLSQLGLGAVEFLLREAGLPQPCGLERENAQGARLVAGIERAAKLYVVVTALERHVVDAHLREGLSLHGTASPGAQRGHLLEELHADIRANVVVIAQLGVIGRSEAID